MKYMIHTLPTRYWYVTKHLIPSMVQQGIRFSEIEVYSDAAGDGNLKSTLKSFSQLSEYGDTWHLQDDVILCSQFKARTDKIPNKLVCGFCSVYDPKIATCGPVSPELMWYSFPCIKIPNNYAHEFVSWIKANEDESDLVKISNNMYDDYLFKKFMEKEHSEDIVLNVAPNLVNNIDYLIGGSALVKREEKIEARYWYEPALIEKLKKELS